ncbi:multicopper oxidase family protein [Pseudohoeflea coraliihabitans]|uniref:Multicopper oxidase domain-containing protein n=1 Tax=Pseudohoeflea coraliihabitans TaxID=2860393 RepID=A0ABS6WP62_9HYPH|nr:multicopper oxidase domain-containing protein [Pseudohoeflea sp. DP4N28-3]MBW3097738.1 multicopper oxidase domain-containing protein [Pseudohoeflea sp. DP4N28-3]
MKRRSFIAGSMAAIAAPGLVGRVRAQPVFGGQLPIPPLMEVGEESGNRLDAIEGTHAFIEGEQAQTLGWSQDHLGPTLRMRRGRTARLTIGNRLESEITSHWHGLHVPGWLDGGPQSLIASGRNIEQALDIDQPAGTFWYHSHPHGRTGDQVYRGLAGLLLIEDDRADTSVLPSAYGVDDIPLIIQDKAFTRRGNLQYDDGGMAAMQGFRGDRIAVNGALEPVAHVPQGLVRFRLLNASNARVYVLSFDDGRRFHQIASDAGLLPAPVSRSQLQLAPAERAEILVDFSNGAEARLVSQDVPVQMMGGMMGGGMMGGGSDLEVLKVVVGGSRPATVSELPQEFSGAYLPVFGEPVRRREFRLNMMMGMGMMRAMFGGRPTFGINGQAYDMGRIDQQLRRGETEIWEISADMMSHPFHVHGTSFQVLTQNGISVDFAETGMKDVVWIENSAEILVRFDHPATPEAPYMYHCHILEHEDSGMMGQFTVS